VSLHRSSGRRGLGFGLALTTMALWAVLPLALKGVLEGLDALTITWTRFAVATLLLAGVLAARGGLPSFRGAGGRGLALLAVATLFLAANYWGYLVALDWTTAADAQVLIQLAPLLLALGGLLVFRERFTGLQWVGVLVLVSGLALFLGGRLSGVVDAAVALPEGIAMMSFAAVTWAIYGLAQKQLLQRWSSAQILLCVYAGCTLVFTPLADPGALRALGSTQAWLLAFCALNTVLGYGAFAESLEHWEASRVGAVLALTPLGTLLCVLAVDALHPGWAMPQPLPVASWLGALLVVAGSLTTSLAAPEEETR